MRKCPVKRSNVNLDVVLITLQVIWHKTIKRGCTMILYKIVCTADKFGVNVMILYIQDL